MNIHKLFSALDDNELEEAISYAMEVHQKRIDVRIASELLMSPEESKESKYAATTDIAANLLDSEDIEPNMASITHIGKVNIEENSVHFEENKKTSE